MRSKVIVEGWPGEESVSLQKFPQRDGLSALQEKCYQAVHRVTSGLRSTAVNGMWYVSSQVPGRGESERRVRNDREMETDACGGEGALGEKEGTRSQLHGGL